MSEPKVIVAQGSVADVLDAIVGQSPEPHHTRREIFSWLISELVKLGGREEAAELLRTLAEGIANNSCTCPKCCPTGVPASSPNRASN